MLPKLLKVSDATWWVDGVDGVQVRKGMRTGTGPGSSATASSATVSSATADGATLAIDEHTSLFKPLMAEVEVAPDAATGGGERSVAQALEDEVRFWFR